MSTAPDTDKVVHISNGRRVYRDGELQALVAEADSSVPWLRCHPLCTTNCRQGRACDCVPDVDEADLPDTDTGFEWRIITAALVVAGIAIVVAVFGQPVELPR